MRPLLRGVEASLGYAVYILDWKADRYFGETHLEPMLGGLMHQLIPN